MAEAGSNAAYAGLVETVDLMDVRLVESQFKMKPDILNPDQSAWKYGYGCALSETNFDEENGIITAWVDASAYAKAGRSQILNVKARYLLVYRVNGGSDEETVQKFTHNVGPISVYPYFRSLFADLVSQGGARVPPLPIMKGLRRPLRVWADAEVAPK